MTTQPLRFSGNVSDGFLSMELAFTPAMIEQIIRRDNICKETSLPIMKEFNQSRDWVPIVKDGKQSAKVLLVLDGPEATKITIMEGTRIIDRGSGAKFIHKNSRFLHCQPEVTVIEKQWMDSTHMGISLAATSAVFRMPAPVY